MILGKLRCLEAPQGQPAGSMSAGGGGCEAPISWEQHLTPSRLSSMNLEVLAEKVDTLGLQGRLNWTWYHIIYSSQSTTQHCCI